MGKAKTQKEKAAQAASTGTSNMSTDKENVQQVSDLNETKQAADTPVDQGADVSSNTAPAAGESEQTGNDSAKPESDEGSQGVEESNDGAEELANIAAQQEAEAQAAADKEAQEKADEETRLAKEKADQEAAEKARKDAAIAAALAAAPIQPQASVSEDNAPQWLKVQRGRLKEYVAAMGGSILVSDQEQLNHQNVFRGIINDLLTKRRGQEFFDALDSLLSTIHENRNYAFKDKYVFRQYLNLPVSAIERNVLVNVVTLLLNLADPSTRSLVQAQVDISAALKNVRDAEAVHALLLEYIK